MWIAFKIRIQLFKITLTAGLSLLRLPTLQHPITNSLYMYCIRYYILFTCESFMKSLIRVLPHSKTFPHVQHIADKLSRRKGVLPLYDLDLCFNRIYMPDWKTFLPLVKQLADCVEYMNLEATICQRYMRQMLSCTTWCLQKLV